MVESSCLLSKIKMVRPLPENHMSRSCESNTDEIIILNGIKSGDVVVSLGAKSIANGDIIKINA